MMEQNTKKYFFIITFIITILVSLWIIKPFISSILLAIIIVVLTYPLFKKANKIIKNKKLCSFLLSLFIALVIIFSLVISIDYVGTEAKKLFLGGGINLIDCAENEKIICKAYTYIKKAYELPLLHIFFYETKNTVIAALLRFSSDVILAFPKLFFNFIIIFFLLFFLYIEGNNMLVTAKKMIPLEEQQKTQIINKIKDTIHAIIFGQMIIGLIECIIAIFGFKWAGFPLSVSIICGVMVFFFAFIPLLGPTIVWIPLAAIKLFMGQISGTAIIITIGLIISALDTFLKPQIVGSKINLNPLLILFGMFGGIALFGLIGFFIGPIVLGVCAIFFEFILKQKREND